MANMVPASNVQAASLAGFIAMLILHVCAANGITIPADVSEALPGVIVALVAYIHDTISGGNQKPPTD